MKKKIIYTTNGRGDKINPVRQKRRDLGIKSGRQWKKYYKEPANVH